MVLARLRMKLETEERLSMGMSSLFHGLLMELIDEDLAGGLHSGGLQPYTQHLELSKEGNYWVVTAFTEEIVEGIIKKSLLSLQEFTLKKQGIHGRIVEKNYEEFPFQQLTSAFYTEKANPYISLQFLSPTCFKQNGNYIHYPDLRLLFKNLMHKYDEAGFGEEGEDEETLNALVEDALVSQYHLRSTVFYLEGHKLPAFTGKLTLKMKGTQALCNFARFLFRFGEYSGVGIKTALGMGALKLLEENDYKKEKF